MSLPHTFFIGRGGGVDGLYDLKVGTNTFDFKFGGNNAGGAKFGLNLANAKTRLNTLNGGSSSDWYNDTANFDVQAFGMYRWTVPKDADYKFHIKGASGGYKNYAAQNPYFGSAYPLIATFTLTEGEIITIAVGQMGGTMSNKEGSGGGGTFVVADGGNYSSATQAQILAIAGGGGAGFMNATQTNGGGRGLNGNGGNSATANGGGNGSGGEGGRLTDGGGGFFTQGGTDGDADGVGTHGYAGKSYRQGLTGGDGNTGSYTHACTGTAAAQTNGGFGGGSGVSYAASGAGGGYNGGAGDDGCGQQGSGGGSSWVNTTRSGYISSVGNLTSSTQSAGYVEVTIV